MMMILLSLIEATLFELESSLRKYKLKKVYLVIKKAEFELEGWYQTEGMNKKDWNQSGWQVLNQFFVKGS